MKLSHGEEVRVWRHASVFVEALTEKIKEIVEVPEGKDGRKFVKNFIKQAVEDKLAHLSQKEG